MKFTLWKLHFLQSFCIMEVCGGGACLWLLPGTPGQRISDLCNGNHITQKELAEKIGVSASQLSRIVSGETRTVSSDILIGVAKEFKVSTDYILGLSTVSVRKSYDISELGLSEGAVRGL